jgi:hypothetical protein
MHLRNRVKDEQLTLFVYLGQLLQLSCALAERSMLFRQQVRAKQLEQLIFSEQLLQL